MSFYLIEATIEDIDLLFKWVNDEAVRKSAFHTNIISYEEHKAWLTCKLQSSNCKIFIGYVDDEAIGQVRVDMEDNVAIIDYSVDKQHRGKHYGIFLLEAAANEIRNSKKNVNQMVGRVKYNNISSQRIFEKSGYIKKNEDDSILYYKKIGGSSVKEALTVRRRKISDGCPCYVIAEMSANHAGDIDRAIEIIQAAKNSGADCIKLQTYTPDTMTIESDKEYFQIRKGTWKGESLYNLYQKAYTPWEWHGRLKDAAEKIGIDFLSTPFDKTSVDFLESLGVTAYKIASFELTDIPLIRYIASKNKPIIMSTGMGTLGEIEEAVNAVRSQSNNQLCLLRCSSVYPAVANDMNLKTIQNLKDIFGIPVGLSDHSMGSVGAVAAVAIGANVIEKHFCLSRKIENPDSSFSMEPQEFQRMVEDIRIAEMAIGKVSYHLSEREYTNRIFRRSVFVVKDIKEGEHFTEENIRIIRPSHGLPPKEYEKVLYKIASRDIERGTPLEWSMIL